jgi:hypothetical protein
LLVSSVVYVFNDKNVKGLYPKLALKSTIKLFFIYIFDFVQITIPREITR